MKSGVTETILLGLIKTGNITRKLKLLIANPYQVFGNFAQNVANLTEKTRSISAEKSTAVGRFETTAVEVGAVDFHRPTANTIW